MILATLTAADIDLLEMCARLGVDYLGHMADEEEDVD